MQSLVAQQNQNAAQINNFQIAMCNLQMRGTCTCTVIVEVQARALDSVCFSTMMMTHIWY